MSTVVFYFTTDGEMGSPFDDPQYFGSYQRLFKKIQASGMAVHIARGTSYKGAMQFSPTWEVTHSGDLVLSEQGCKADVIYLKGYGILDQLQHGDAVMNPLRVTTMAHDKWQTYETLQQHMATSILIPKDVSESQWDSILQKIPTDLVVLKPRFGHGGNGVVVLPKANLSRGVLSPDVEYFAQAFITYVSLSLPQTCRFSHL
jgi:glutathione synthase/RimK-type ligase-like ATP-grasp enzyme